MTALRTGVPRWHSANARVAATLCGAVVVAAVFPMAVLPLSGAVFVWLAFTYPRAATAAVAIVAALVRPSLDLFGDVAVPGGNPASLFGAAVLVCALIIVAARVYHDLRIWPSRAFAIPQALLVILHGTLFVSGLAISRTGQLGVEAREFVRFASTLLAGMLAVWWQDDSRENGWQPAIFVVVVASIVPLAAGVTQAVTGTGNHEDGDLNRVFGSFTHPLTFGSYLLPLVILGVAGIIKLRGSAKPFALAFATLTATLLFLTYNRTTILLVLAGLVVYTVLELGEVRLGDMLRVGAAIAVVMLVTWIAFGEEIAQRFSGVSITAGAVQEALATGSQNSFQWRIVNWAILIQLGLAHPIVGHGLGMTTVLNPLIQASSGVPFNAHDDYVRFFFEGGLIGVGLYVAFIATFARWLWRARRNLAPSDRSVAYAIIASMSALYLFSAGTTEMSLQTGVLYQTYLLIAILVGAESRREMRFEHATLVEKV